MKSHRLPAGARPAPLPLSVSFQLATACTEPPAGDGWLYEVKHDGHRIAALALMRAAANERRAAAPRSPDSGVSSKAG
jgi:hypothetical protein